MLFTSNRNVGSNPTLSVVACSLTIQSADLINRTMQVPAGILPGHAKNKAGSTPFNGAVPLPR